MRDETIHELSYRALAAITEAKLRVAPYNDFGSVLGAQDEITEIVEELYTDLHKACRRARRLIARIDKWEDGDRTVTMLHDNPGPCPCRAGD